MRNIFDTKGRQDQLGTALLIDVELDQYGSNDHESQHTKRMNEDEVSGVG